jgi:hypothetical protein
MLDASEMYDCYEFTGQAHHGVVVDRDAVLLLDTMVLSTVYSVTKGGFDLTRRQDRRAAHLLRWLAARPDVAVSPLFGVLEGAGFHAGALDSLDVIRRCTAAIVFATWGREHAEEWIASGASAPPDVAVPDGAVRVENAIELGEALLPWTVLPCYVAALATALVEREGKRDLAAVEAVHGILASDLDFVPAFGWLVSALMFVGTADVRRKLRHKLFKLGRGDVRTQCLSAGWDLGYLQLMSVARTPTVQPLFDGRTPLLVTEDKQLAPSAIRLLCHGDSGAFEIDGDLIDPAWRDDAIALFTDLDTRRRSGLADVALPSWDGCAAAALELERALGIDDAPPLSLRGDGPHVIELEPRAIVKWLEAIATEDAGAALDVLVEGRESGIDLLTSGGVVVAILARDNARARERELQAAFESVLSGLVSAEADAASFTLVAKLVLSIAEEEWTWSTAILRKIVIDEIDGIAIMWFWHLGRKILQDTALARACPVPELIARILVRVRRGSPGGESHGG